MTIRRSKALERVVFAAAVSAQIAGNCIFLLVGVYFVVSTRSSWTICERSYHVQLFLTLSIVMQAISFLIYFIASRPGWEEIARLRATAYIVFHFAFTVWGALSWRQMDWHCEQQAGNLLIFHHTAVAFHGIYFLFFCAHETVLFPSFDWTVMPSVQFHTPEPEMPQYGDYQIPDTSQNPPDTPPHKPPVPKEWVSAKLIDPGAGESWESNESQQLINRRQQFERP